MLYTLILRVYLSVIDVVIPLKTSVLKPKERKMLKPVFSAKHYVYHYL